MRNGERVQVKDAVYYGDDTGRSAAPCGEYRIEPRGDCIGLCECDGSCDFTISIDAFQQHVAEGRIEVAV